MVEVITIAAKVMSNDLENTVKRKSTNLLLRIVLLAMKSGILPLIDFVADYQNVGKYSRGVIIKQ